MKKILILVSNLNMGGFSKSLINFLWCMEQQHPEYKISILAFNEKVASLEKQVPSTVTFHHSNLEYEVNEKQKLQLLFCKIKYVFVEKICRFINKKEIPRCTVQEYLQSILKHKVQNIVTDFSEWSEYEIVISWEEKFCNYILASKFLNKYKVGYIHPNYLEAGFSKKIDNKYLSKLDKIITVSESCKSTLETVFPQYKEKIVCVPNRLNLSYYEKLSEEYQPMYNKNTINLLTVARVVDQARAVFRMANIVERLKMAGFDFKWYLIGNGHDFERLQEVIKEKNIEQYLICLGEMDNPCPYMKDADLYIQQSYYEGRPVSVDEAMMLGTPALITSYSSAKEQVTNGINGWIVENNEECIYKKIKELLQNPELIEKACIELEKEDNEKFENCDAMISMIESLG